MAGVLHKCHFDLQLVLLHLPPSGDIGPLGLVPPLEVQLLRIRQRRQAGRMLPIANTAQDRCRVCSCLAVLQELSEQQMTATASVLSNRNTVALRDCQLVQHRIRVVERASPAVGVDRPSFEGHDGSLMGMDATGCHCWLAVLSCCRQLRVGPLAPCRPFGRAARRSPLVTVLIPRDGREGKTPQGKAACAWPRRSRGAAHRETDALAAKSSAGGPDDFPASTPPSVKSRSENRRGGASRERSWRGREIRRCLLLLRNTDDFAAECSLKPTPSPQNRRCHPAVPALLR